MNKEQMIAQCYPYIVRLSVSFARCIKTMDREDFINEGICAVLEHYDAAIRSENPPAYLCGCVKNTFLHLYRKEKKKDREINESRGYITDPDSLYLPVDAIVLDATAERMLTDISSSYTGNAREGVWYLLCVARGLSRKAIAAHFGCSENHVRACIESARYRLRNTPSVYSYFQEDIA